MTAFVVAASCGSGDGAPAATPTWHCYSIPSNEGTYCNCALATDAELASGGGEKPPWSTQPCPNTDYSCCVRDDKGHCTCYMSGDPSSCGKGASIVSMCPPPEDGGV